jgi:gluconolactonase
MRSLRNASAILTAVLLSPVADSHRFLCAQEAVTGDTSVVVPGSQVELLFDGGFFTEGPAVGPDGAVYFSDITITASSGMQAGHIWRYDPGTGETRIFRSPSGMANGIIFDLEDRMVVAEGADFGGRRVTRTDLTTGRSEILAGLFNSRPFNAPNDLAVDEQGRIYFTDPRYFGHEPIEQPIMGVYRIDPDVSVSLIITDAGKPNGILVSPDQGTLYVAALDPGRLGVLPRGMRSYPGRRLYLTRGRRLEVYSPSGEMLAQIPVPEPARNATFGRGKTARILYITAGRSLYRIEVKNAGYRAGR